VENEKIWRFFEGQAHIEDCTAAELLNRNSGQSKHDFATDNVVLEGNARGSSEAPTPGYNKSKKLAGQKHHYIPKFYLK